MKTGIRVEPVQLVKLVLDDEIQSRAAIIEAAVKDYAESMRQGDEFPPLEVFEHDNQYHLADGFHRKLAAEEVGLETIPCRIHPGGKEEAFKFSLRANSTHGERRTNADKRLAVKKAFSIPGMEENSNELIAEICAVSGPFVAKVRQAMTSKGLKSSTKRRTKSGRFISHEKIGKKTRIVKKARPKNGSKAAEPAPTMGQSESRTPETTPSPDTVPGDTEQKAAYNTALLETVKSLSGQLQTVMLSEDPKGWLEEDSIAELQSLSGLITEVLSHWNA